MTADTTLAPCPTEQQFVITEEWLHANTTPAGGWCAAQLKAIGVGWPPAKGWPQRSVGQAISPQAKAAFEAGTVSKSQARKLNRQAAHGITGAPNGKPT